jgi:hypothetical protein
MTVADYTKEFFQGALLDSPAPAAFTGAPAGAERSANAVLSEIINIAVGVAGTAGTPLAESEATPIPFDGEVLDVYFTALTGVVQDPTNVATFVLSKYDAAGANKTTVASKQTLTGGGGSVTAKAGYQLTLAAGAQNVVRGGCFTVEVTKQGSGVATPAGNLTIVLRQRNV